MPSTAAGNRARSNNPSGRVPAKGAKAAGKKSAGKISGGKKDRWTAKERAEKGRRPQRRTDRDPRGAGRDTRESGFAPGSDRKREDRPQRTPRFDTGRFDSGQSERRDWASDGRLSTDRKSVGRTGDRFVADRAERPRASREGFNRFGAGRSRPATARDRRSDDRSFDRTDNRFNDGGYRRFDNRADRRADNSDDRGFDNRGGDRRFDNRNDRRFDSRGDDRRTESRGFGAARSADGRLPDRGLDRSGAGDRSREDRRGNDRARGFAGRSGDSRSQQSFGSGPARTDDRRESRGWTDRPREDRASGDRRSEARRSFDRGDERRGGERRSWDRGSQDRPRTDSRAHDRPRTDRGPREQRWGDDAGSGRFDQDDSDLMTWSGDSFDDPTDTDATTFDSVAAQLDDEAGPGSTSADDAADTSAELTDEATIGFGAYGLPAPVLAALTKAEITQPFPIQAATIPDAMAGRDVLGRGRTGSGKTLAFGLPLITRLAKTKGAGLPRGLVLVPTRELALQVADVLAPLARTVGVSVTLIAGGMPYGPQRKAFERGVDLVVATPGRLIDLQDQAVCDLSGIEVTVLDEADHMADLGFLPDVTRLLDSVPGDGQRMLFSATLDAAIDRLVKTYLTDPVTHQVDSDRASITTMTHHVALIQPRDKVTLTAEITAREGRTVVFVRTQRAADRVAEQLRGEGVVAGALHGGLSQGARGRILTAFRDGRVPVLVATDVAARGIHVDEVGVVLQVDPPKGPKDYLHRAGRTARAGGSGVVVTLVLPHQRREMERLTRQAGVSAESIDATPGSPALAETTGARTPVPGSVLEADYQRLVNPPKARTGPSRGPRRSFGHGPRHSRGPRR